MIFIYDNKEYEVNVIKKHNKNTYVRIRDGKIIVTTSYFATKKSILRLLEENKNSIGRMLDRYNKKVENSKNFYFLGELYQVIVENVKNVTIDGVNRVISCSSMDEIDKYLRKIAKDIFSCHLEKIYGLFEENIPYPSLRIRKMKSRWGVCNTKSHIVTLNLELMHYRVECLDYVIVHELSHLLVPNHSNRFWKVVSKYCSNYKELRKELR